jgi:site-specific recombinase XerD
VKKPLASVTLTDLQAWAETLGQGSPASQNRALTAVKSLLSFAHETGYLPFNVGIAVKLRPNRDSLAQRILEESEVARLIEAAAPGRQSRFIETPLRLRRPRQRGLRLAMVRCFGKAGCRPDYRLRQGR